MWILNSLYSFMLQWLCHHPTQNTTIDTPHRCGWGALSLFYSLFNTTLTLWMSIISTTLTFTSSLAAASLPLAATKQRASYLLLLLNDGNKSHHPHLSLVTGGRKGGESWEMGKLTIPGIPAWLLLLTSSVCICVCLVLGNGPSFR